MVPRVGVPSLIFCRARCPPADGVRLCYDKPGLFRRKGEGGLFLCGGTKKNEMWEGEMAVSQGLGGRVEEEI